MQENLLLARYLDHAATTPLQPAVVDAMREALLEFGNPGSSTHAFGAAAAALLDEYRQRFAALLGVAAGEIVFTGSATEANNLALRGWLYRRGQLLSVATEHSAVLEVAESLRTEGYDCQIVPVDAQGHLDAESFARALQPHTLASVMAVNNETGVVQDLAGLYARCQAHSAGLHVDAAQALGKLDPLVLCQHSDMTTFNAHKCGGPKGIGALRVRASVRLRSIIDGGGQERGRRAGTEALHQVAGLVVAAEQAEARRHELWQHAQHLRAALLHELADVGAWRVHGEGVPHIVNLGFDGVQGESLILGMPEIAVSSGSACASQRFEASHVLSAMGVDALAAQGAVRVSFGVDTTLDEARLAGQCLAREVRRLRALSPPLLPPVQSAHPIDT